MTKEDSSTSTTPTGIRCGRLPGSQCPIHWHAGAGIRLSIPRWKGFTRNQEQAMGPAGGFSNQAQFIPNLIFSGVLDRFPRLRWVCAETGIGWVNYMLEACDHEWERRHLWTQGS